MLFHSFLLTPSLRKDEGSCHTTMIQRSVYILRDNHTFVIKPQGVLLFPEPPLQTTRSRRYQDTVPGYSLQNPNFFRSLELTKTIIFMVLFLILTVASFNIVSTLVMLIRQKKSSIAVMRGLGVDHLGIFKIFLCF